jgi:CheY-like chemotaxis protein
MTDSSTNAESRAEQAAAQGAHSDVCQQWTRLRILLAEDSPTNQLIARASLERAGHVVEVVDNGRKAIQALEEQDFDLVLMDVFMPEMDGTEAARIIRQSETGSGRHIPIIAMTATDTQEHRDVCLESGMDGFVSKPVSPNELYDAIEQLGRGSIPGG